MSAMPPRKKGREVGTKRPKFKGGNAQEWAAEKGSRLTALHKYELGGRINQVLNVHWVLRLCHLCC
jgi:hypothetical protein